MPQVIINIGTDGQTTVDAQGYTGTECKDATRAIEMALGTTTQDEKKPEYSQRAARRQKGAQQQ